MHFDHTFMTRMKSILLLTFLAAGTLATAADEEKAEQLARTVVLDEMAVKNLGLETVAAEESDFSETVFALGRIEVLPGNKGVVSSRVPGRVQSVIALPDMLCDEGDELIWVESRQAGDPPPVVRLDAPIGGTIAKVGVAVGQPVEPGDSLIEIYNLETVEAAAAVPAHRAGVLKKGMNARIRVAGFPDTVFEAELNHLGADADPETGTVEAAFHVPNPDGLLRPGLRAEFSIEVDRREGVMSIPRQAVQGEGANRFVFIKDYDLPNAFVKTPVVLGAQNDERVEVVEGLLPGDEVVVRGGYSLAFAGKGSVSLKEALDAAHGHPHNEDGTEMTADQIAAAQAAAGGGEAGGAHGQGADGSRVLFWQISTGLLALLLLLSALHRRAAPPVNHETLE
jgi:multidrug efflux pump subunit AcrA (membrane-fusion protein)